MCAYIHKETRQICHVVNNSMVNLLLHGVFVVLQILQG